MTTRAFSEQYSDPREAILSELNLDQLHYLARQVELMRQGRKEEIIQRFLTSFLSVEDILESLKKEDLIELSRHFELSPLPKNRSQAIEQISRIVIGPY